MSISVQYSIYHAGEKFRRSKKKLLRILLLIGVFFIFSAQSIFALEYGFTIRYLGIKMTTGVLRIQQTNEMRYTTFNVNMKKALIFSEYTCCMQAVYNTDKGRPETYSEEVNGNRFWMKNNFTWDYNRHVITMTMRKKDLRSQRKQHDEGQLENCSNVISHSCSEKRAYLRKNSVQEEEYQMTADIHLDPLNFFNFMIQQVCTNGQVISAHYFYYHDSEVALTIEQDDDVVKTPMGKYTAFKIIGRGFQTDVLKQSGDVWLWFSSDGTMIPLKLVFQTSFGKIVAVLQYIIE